ncbi:MAG TPA: hypothetical protein VF326_05990 [Anaerolineaceae bacterium]
MSRQPYFDLRLHDDSELGAIVSRLLASLERLADRGAFVLVTPR